MFREQNLKQVLDKWITSKKQKFVLRVPLLDSLKYVILVVGNCSSALLEALRPACPIIEAIVDYETLSGFSAFIRFFLAVCFNRRRKPAKHLR